MVSRRQSLQLAGSAAVAALAGCSTDASGADAEPAHFLHVDRIATDPVWWALYDPPADDLFGGPARDALDAVLPTGRYTTAGYVALPEGKYVDHEGRYYRTEQFVSGRTDAERPVVRVERDEDAVPEDALSIDALEQPSTRPLKILHSHAVSDGESGASDLLRGDGYVMTRPAELDSRLGAGDIDGRVVTMTDEGRLAYRIDVRRERVTLTEHTALAVEVAASEAAFREVVLASGVDVDLGVVDLSEAARGVLDDAVGRAAYRETGDPSAAFESLLDALGFEVGESETGRIVWYGDSVFRASYYVDPDG